MGGAIKGGSGEWEAANLNSGELDPAVLEAANRAVATTFDGFEPEAVWTEIKHPRMARAGAWIVRRLEIKI